MDDRTCKIMNMLRQRGYKCTPQREAIIRGFLKTEKPVLTARDLYEKLIESIPNTNFSTVYRNLELLTDEGIITKMDMGKDAALYELKDEKGHHHYLICKSCGKIQETDYCPFKDMELNADFLAIDHRFEVYGLCGACVKNNEEKD